MKSVKENTDHNKVHYDQLYENVNIDTIIHKVNNIDAFLANATTTDTSWVCMYYDNFKEKLKGKRVLELGCGDCTNAAIMSALGAEVWANDISHKSGVIIQKLNAKLPKEHHIHYLNGDFLEIDFESNFFDMVIGKAFIHHLTHEQELRFIEKIVAALKPDGLVRFVEPAINNKLIDTLRWMTPMNDRPSSLQKKKFRAWKEMDPHPDRDNSGKHYKQLGESYFKDVTVFSIGMLERFHRFFPNAKWSRAFRKKALKLEKHLPNYIRYVFARTQTIDYKGPLGKSNH